MRLLVLDPRNLAPEPLDPLKCSPRRNRVDEEESLSLADPLISQRSVLLLTCSVEDLEHTGLIVDDRLLAVRVLDCWVVRLDKVVETELDRQCRLAYTSISEDDELVDHHLAAHLGRVSERGRQLVKTRNKDDGDEGVSR